MRAVTISRTKAVVHLPPRMDEIHHLVFTSAERQLYEATKTQSRMLLEEAISAGYQVGKTFNALRLLNTLRKVCNHGLLTQSTLDKKTALRPQASPEWRSPLEVSDMLSDAILAGAFCSNCGRDVLEDALEDSVTSNMESRMILSDQIICDGCHSQANSSRLSPSAWNIRDFPDSAECSAPATPSVDSNEFSIDLISTKIKALVADLYKHNTTDKR